MNRSVSRWLRLLPTIAYVILIYGFIFLPVLVLVLFSFQETRIPIPPFNGPSLKWYTALFASFALSVTFSWDEFIIAFMVSRFDVTLPVEIWSMLRTGLNPKTNAVGSLVFLVSFVIVFAFDFVVFRRRQT